MKKKTLRSRRELMPRTQRLLRSKRLLITPKEIPTSKLRARNTTPPRLVMTALPMTTLPLLRPLMKARLRAPTITTPRRRLMTTRSPRRPATRPPMRPRPARRRPSRRPS